VLLMDFKAPEGLLTLPEPPQRNWSIPLIGGFLKKLGNRG